MAAPMNPFLTNPKAIAKAGEEIYNSLRAELEENHIGKFVAINVKTSTYHLGDTPEEALQEAKKADPQGLFHLIRVGFSGAFQISYALQNTDSDWLFR